MSVAATSRVMGDEQRFERWASGILGVVSLALILNLARMITAYRKASLHPAVRAARLNPQPAPQIAGSKSDVRGAKPDSTLAKLDAGGAKLGKVDAGTAKLAALGPARTQEQRQADVRNARHEPSARQATEMKPAAPPHRAHAISQPEVELRQPRRTSSQPQANATRAVEQPQGITATARPNSAQPQAAATPRVVEMQPFGYVQKADGSREAAVSEGDRVFLVHEGETFDDHYRVLKISPSSVQVADLEAPAEGEPSTSTTLAENRAGPAQPAASLTQAEPVGAAAIPERSARRLRKTEAFALAADLGQSAGARDFKDSPLQAVKATGRKTARLPLTMPSDSFGAHLTGGSDTSKTLPHLHLRVGRTARSERTHATVEDDKMSKRRLSTGLSSAARTSSETDHDKMSVSSARPGKVIPVTQLRKKILPDSQGPESLGFVEWPGHPSGTIVAEGDGIRLVPDQSQVGQVHGVEPPPTFAGQAAIGATSIEEVASRTDGLSQMKFGPDEIAQPTRTFKSYCYAEKADGTREAFVMLGDRSYLARQGELLANRYRVLKITPVSIEVEDYSGSKNKSLADSIREMAEDDSKFFEAAEFARPSMPEALPLRNLAQTFTVALADALPTIEGERIDRAKSSAGIQFEPTLPKTWSSTLSMPVVQSGNLLKELGESSFLNSSLASPSSEKEGAKIKSSRASHEARIRKGFKAPLPVPGSTGITPLPLDTHREASLFDFPPSEVTGSQGLTRASGWLPGLSQFGPWRRMAAGQGKGRSSAMTMASVSTPTGATSLARLQPSSAGGLHLNISIGDNGCYFPR